MMKAILHLLKLVLLLLRILTQSFIKIWRVIHQKKIIINIEGNIAAGKSTVMASLQHTFTDMLIIPEPVHNWETTLQLVQEQPGKGYEFLLQLIISDDFQHAYHTLTHSNKSCITERSFIASLEVFCNIYKDYGTQFMNEHQFNYLKKKGKLYSPQYDACIYIDTSVENCLARLTSRARSCETNIKRKYLELIENKYKKMIQKLNAENKSKQHVYIIDGNRSKKDVTNEIIKLIKNLQNK